MTDKQANLSLAVDHLIDAERSVKAAESAVRRALGYLGAQDEEEADVVMCIRRASRALVTRLKYLRTAQE